MISEELEFAGALDRAMFTTDILPGQYAYGFQLDHEGMIV